VNVILVNVLGIYIFLSKEMATSDIKRLEQSIKEGSGFPR